MADQCSPEFNYNWNRLKMSLDIDPSKVKGLENLSPDKKRQLALSFVCFYSFFEDIRFTAFDKFRSTKPRKSQRLSAFQN